MVGGNRQAHIIVPPRVTGMMRIIGVKRAIISKLIIMMNIWDTFTQFY